MDERTPEKDTPNKPAGMFRRLPADDLDLATDIRTTLLVQNPRGGRIIVWLILLFVVVFLVWASLSEIDEVTRSDGKVIPSQQIQVVQNLEGGILGKLHVQVGDIVDKDQLLIEIDKTRLSAPYMESRVGYLALKAQIARLEAEVRDTAFTVPEEVAAEKPLRAGIFVLAGRHADGYRLKTRNGFGHRGVGRLGRLAAQAPVIRALGPDHPGLGLRSPFGRHMKAVSARRTVQSGHLDSWKASGC